METEVPWTVWAGWAGGICAGIDPRVCAGRVAAGFTLRDGRAQGTEGP